MQQNDLAVATHYNIWHFAVEDQQTGKSAVETKWEFKLLKESFGDHAEIYTDASKPRPFQHGVCNMHKIAVFEQCPISP